MTPQSDNLNSSLIGYVLGERPFRYFQQVSSTNNVAQKWAAEGALAGSVVLADEQTSGRGRMGRQWVSPAGQAIAMSVILYPTIDEVYLHRLTMAGGLAVIEILSDYVNPSLLALKWPNDVILDGRKVSGILSEGLWLGEHLQSIILGIGLNVRVDFKNTSLESIATSLEPYSLKPISRLLLVLQILTRIDFWIEQLQSDLLINSWRDHLGTIGRHVILHTHQGEISGLATDVDTYGALVVLNEKTNEEYRILAGDISIAEE